MRACAWALLFSSLFACGGGDDDADSDVVDSGVVDAMVDASDSHVQEDARGDTREDVDPPDTSDPRELVTVSHARELRGVWVATVFNINFPSRTGLSVEAQQDELVALIEGLANNGYNAMFFQVRPEGDALYRSELEPWSRFLTGTQGEDPGWDPLAFAIEQSHTRGIELHAWLNPYRAKVSTRSSLATGHMAQRFPEHAHVYGSNVWMDPASRDVQDHTLAVVRDIVTRYDVDGVHLDDYFYPYPQDTAFPDGATYAAYQAGGGTLERNDWRRDNVNQMVRRLDETVRDADPNVRFGISPFGIYRPGMPAGIRGLDQYDAIFADPVLWMNEGWLDYLAPQLYWPTTQAAQAYEPLLDWWVDQAAGETWIIPGNYLSELGSEPKWSREEFIEEVRLGRDRPGAPGNIFFHSGPIMENRLGITDALRSTFYQDPVALPVMVSARGETMAPPDLDMEGASASLSHRGDPRHYAVYRAEGAGFIFDRLTLGSTTAVTLASGRWAISAIDRRGVESQGVVVTVP